LKLHYFDISLQVLRIWSKCALFYFPDMAVGRGPAAFVYHQLFPEAVIDEQNDSFSVATRLFNYCHRTDLPLRREKEP